jgi:hypothetical protein
VLFFGSLLFAWLNEGSDLIESAVQPFTLLAVAMVFAVFGIVLDALANRGGGTPSIG